MDELLKKASLRELRLLLLGIGAVITVGLLSATVIPNVKALAAAQRTVASLAQASRDGGELDRHLREQHAAIEELKRRLHGDMANLPVRQIESFIIGRLQRVSWNNDVVLLSVEPAIGERVQIFQEMLFKVQLIGQYNDLYRWLWHLRDELGYVVVKEYSLRRRDNGDERPQLLAELSLASYRAVR